MAYVKLSALPDQHKIYTLDFPTLDGGINLSVAEYQLPTNQSPEIVNLWWEDGAIQTRPGQAHANVSLADGTSPLRLGAGYAATTEPFHGSTILHIGTGLYRCRYGDGDAESALVLSRLASGVPANRGTFFRFGDWLFYKNRGGFFKIAYSSGTFAASSVASDAYTPTIVINANPEDGAGDLYQPENRLSPKKRITYNAATAPSSSAATGNGTSRIFTLELSNAELKKLAAVSAVRVDGETVDTALYDVNVTAGTVTFRTAPGDGKEIVFDLQMKSPVYKLPVGELDSVVRVVVDGKTLTAGKDYRVNLVAGTVTFTEAPPVTDPPTNNTVEITYAKTNRNACNAVMNCSHAAVYGTGTQLCVVLGGDTGRAGAQPNAVFWSGNTDVGLDPSYWPMSYYNLVGDTEDEITGFGKQYDELFVFKARSLGKLSWSVESIDGRDSISLTYSRVNDRTGCDLPWSIQLVENNLIFANTGRDAFGGGVYRVLSSSSAYENNVERVSGKIDGDWNHTGLLYHLRTLGTAEGVTSHDDGRRYFLQVGTHVWVWDYSISTGKDPAWFYWTGFDGVAAWFQRDGTTYHVNGAGRITRMARVFADYGAGFRKVYRFPVRHFGSYDRLKDVLTLIVAAMNETPTRTDLVYRSDYEERVDLTPLTGNGAWSLTPRDLSFRDLSANYFSRVFRRRPKCRHIRHFAFRLENSNAGENLAIFSAQIQYRFLGRDR